MLTEHWRHKVELKQELLCNEVLNVEETILHQNKSQNLRMRPVMGYVCVQCTALWV